MKEPKEKICLLIYNASLTTGDISKKLYDYRNPKVSTWLGELLEKQWITEEKRKEDRRENYYHATSKCLLDSIEEDIRLNSHEREKLKNLFESEDFKKLIGLFPVETSDFYSIKQFIAFLSMVTNTFNNFTKDKQNFSSKEYKKYFLVTVKKLIPKSDLRQTIKEAQSKYFIKDSPVEIPFNIENFMFEFMGFGSDLLNKLSSLVPGYNIIGVSMFMFFKLVDKLPRKINSNGNLGLGLL